MPEQDCLIIELYRRKRAAADALHELSRELETFFRGREDGEYDGHEIAITGEHGRFFLYGADARALREAVRPIVETCRAIQSGTFTCRRAAGDGPQGEQTEETTPVVFSRKKPALDEREHDGEALVKAASAGKLNEVKRLLAAGVPPDYVARRGKRTALHAAAEKGKLPVVEALLAAGASVVVRDEDGLTPLGHAVAQGQKSVLPPLLAAGADVNGIEGDEGLESTPLLIAVGEGDEEMFDLLVSRGADINACAEKMDSHLVRWTPLSYALQHEQHRLARRLLDMGADCTRSHLALALALQQGIWPLADELLKRGSPINPTAADSDEGPLLESLCQLDNEDAALWLLRRGAKASGPDKSGMHAVHHAAMKGHARVMEELMKRGESPTNPDREGTRPLNYVAKGVLQKLLFNITYKTMEMNLPDERAGYIGCVRSLWARFIETDHGGVSSSQKRSMRALLEGTTNSVSAASDDIAGFPVMPGGWTVLHLAASLNLGAPCRRLVAKGATIDAPDSLGLTPLWWAVALGQGKAVRTLMKLGAQADATNSLDYSPSELLTLRPLA